MDGRRGGGRKGTTWAGTKSTFGGRRQSSQARVRWGPEAFAGQCADGDGALVVRGRGGASHCFGGGRCGRVEAEGKRERWGSASMWPMIWRE